jgi:hypothetical protein
MHITFDPAKDTANIAKHGVSLGLAAHLDWDGVLVKPDTRNNYGELRQIGYGLVGARLYCVVFVDRADVRRVISLRKANQREFDRYESKTDSTD